MPRSQEREISPERGASAAETAPGRPTGPFGSRHRPPSRAAYGLYIFYRRRRSIDREEGCPCTARPPATSCPLSPKAFGAGPRRPDPRSKPLDERVAFLGAPIDDTSPNDVTARLRHLEHRDPDRDVPPYTASPGASGAR
ncbi:ATP-dependent Clp protease proteolytic subunit [Streptomyces sp. NPDC059944]|uniref:ATP-dependent Clp protease proteolytic subunit n=1 Tax=unclassified Streptomyces TaxID=2593676 RepID=UPI0036580962